MNPYRRTLTAALVLAPLVARAQQPGYVTLNNVLPVEAPAGKIEVAEFFWYGCIHCYHLEDMLHGWLAKLPQDVHFRRVPAVFNNPRYATDAAVYYAFEAMGLLDKMHRPFFDAIHRERQKFPDKAALHAWLGSKGVDVKKFDATFSSFGVQSKVKRATQLTIGAQVDGTPMILVAGRYLVPAVPDLEGLLANTDRVLPVARKALAATK
jgi:protein dithiol oxidoreductase (disulfide-forming)